MTFLLLFRDEETDKKISDNFLNVTLKENSEEEDWNNNRISRLRRCHAEGKPWQERKG
jgi:hypothetical protein